MKAEIIVKRVRNQDQITTWIPIELVHRKKIAVTENWMKIQNRVCRKIGRIEVTFDPDSGLHFCAKAKNVLEARLKIISILKDFGIESNVCHSA